MKKLLSLLVSAVITVMGMMIVGIAGCSAGASERDAFPEDTSGSVELAEAATEAEQPTEENGQSSQGQSEETETPESTAAENTDTTENAAAMKMNVQIGDKAFTATLEDNAAVRELTEMMKQAPISISMDDYAGFEKVGPLGRSLTTDNHQTATAAGDIVLYSGNQIVMFYGSNSWSYTRIGKIDDLSGWEEALGSGSITAVFSLLQ